MIAAQFNEKQRSKITRPALQATLDSSGTEKIPKESAIWTQTVPRNGTKEWV